MYRKKTKLACLLNGVQRHLRRGNGGGLISFFQKNQYYPNRVRVMLYIHAPPLQHNVALVPLVWCLVCGNSEIRGQCAS